MVSIAIIGNCQAVGIGQAMREMLPAFEIKTAFSRDLRNNAVNLAEIVSADVVFSQQKMQRQVEEAISGIGGKPLIRYFPELFFTGHCPDLIYANYGDQALPGPFGGNNSAIVLYGWLNGWTEEEILRCFNGDAYEALGYYKHFETGRSEFLRLADECGVDLHGEFELWTKTGRFMHCANHPKPYVFAGLARQLLRSMSIQPEIAYPEQWMRDDLSNFVWAYYPEVAERLGDRGEYKFYYRKGAQVSAGTKSIFDLPEFIELSLAAYSALDPAKVASRRLTAQNYDVLARFRSAPIRKMNPYRGLPDDRFWRKAVAGVAPCDLDPVVSTSFVLDEQTKVATGGSCFAQHIARRLARDGYNYYVPEDGAGLPQAQRELRNYGVFSARYGNIYTTRQLLQLMDRAYGRFVPTDDIWLRPDGRYADALRPEIEPDGFASEEEVIASRSDHLADVRKMFEGLDVFVFTLGLTEAWMSAADGTVYPLAPGVSAGEMDSSRYLFKNFTAQEVARDLDAFIMKLRAANPSCRILLTVSPVPLLATYEARHVLVSTTYSKAALRTAADEVCRSNSMVDYFPSYEIITGAHSRGHYFEDDLRTVTQEGVDHVMRVFMKHYSRKGPGAAAAENAELARELSAGREIVCDEEAIEKSMSETSVESITESTSTGTARLAKPNLGRRLFAFARRSIDPREVARD